MTYGLILLEFKGMGEPVHIQIQEAVGAGMLMKWPEPPATRAPQNDNEGTVTMRLPARSLPGRPNEIRFS